VGKRLLYYGEKMTLMESWQVLALGAGLFIVGFILGRMR
jgi:hypothetical protein